MSRLLPLITSPDPAVRHTALEVACADLSAADLLAECAALDAFRRHHENLYERVRALFFLYAIHRFHLPARLSGEAAAGAQPGRGLVPFAGYTHLLNRRFEEAIDHFLARQAAEGPSDGLSSALAAAYYRLGFQTLADQVRRSVRSVRGNQWMFRMGHPLDQPLRLRPELCQPDPDGVYPVLRECTPVRMDLTHCGWSDIFFLGMDYPEGAKVLNVSIDLGVHGRDAAPRPPVEVYLRVLPEPVLRLTSVDLGCTADVTHLAEVFDFARDYLGLLKAAVIASGLVPPGIEGSGHDLSELLARLCGPGCGLELVSRVNDIPKGSRLAVSTSLLAALVAVCMRATGQAASLTGPLEEPERRLVLARALLGEWLGGSGGGWQDSGGVWPGMKLIEGALATEGDPEHGISRGRLMPTHRILTEVDAPASTRQKLQDSLVLVHGGMAQNVGPILEMVTEKYLLRSEKEWTARQSMLGILDEILTALRRGDIRAIGAATTRNFQQPIQTIIPWASNYFTETLIERVRADLGQAFWVFWMLGGMSGGGMGFIVAPHRKAEAQRELQAIMSATKRELQHALPFAMEPVVYDFAINEHGTWAELLAGEEALLPAGYYALHAPRWLRADPQSLTPARRADLDQLGAATRTRPELAGMTQVLFDRLVPRLKSDDARPVSLEELLAENGFDRAQHEQIREELRGGRIGLAQNRLPASADIRDVKDEDVRDATRPLPDELRAAGLAALQRGELAVVTLAAGVGSRWTQGAGVVKALHPFCAFAGAHRTFLETHLAKSRRGGRRAGCPLPHVFTTSYLTHAATEDFLRARDNYAYPGPLHLSPGRSIGLDGKQRPPLGVPHREEVSDSQSVRVHLHLAGEPQRILHAPERLGDICFLGAPGEVAVPAVRSAHKEPQSSQGKEGKNGHRGHHLDDGGSAAGMPDASDSRLHGPVSIQGLDAGHHCAQGDCLPLAVLPPADGYRDLIQRGGQFGDAKQTLPLWQAVGRALSRAKGDGGKTVGERAAEGHPVYQTVGCQHVLGLDAVEPRILDCLNVTPRQGGRGGAVVRLDARLGGDGKGGAEQKGAQKQHTHCEGDLNKGHPSPVAEHPGRRHSVQCDPPVVSQSCARRQCCRWDPHPSCR